ncbi:3-isopropylmalate dehydratase small subunit [Amycolatopsis sp. NPDC054798]
MIPVVRHEGRAVVLGRSDIDTDQIIPAEYCKRLTKSGYADALFAHWRTEPGFVLNTPAAAGASTLLASRNFGTGSSREHAVWALRDWGFDVVVAASYGDIFQRNAWKNGLMAIALPLDELEWLTCRVEADAEFRIAVDLEKCELAAGGRAFSFDVDERARRLLLNGRDEISETLADETAIVAHEKTRAEWLPKLHPGCLSGLSSATAGAET